MAQNIPQTGANNITWMQRPQGIDGVPHGLEYLYQLDQIHVKQLHSLLEVFTGWDANNKYILSNAAGQQIFFAAEDTETCMRICCANQRGFLIHILDNANQEVMRVTREFKCLAGCCWCAGSCDCCAHEVTIEAPPGQIVGYVRQIGSKWKPRFKILDEFRETALEIEGPCCILDGPFCPCENEFKVLSKDRVTEVGKVSKIYAGFIKESFTLADNFGIWFPIDLNVKLKATMIGALFLIDLMYFEKKNDN